MSRAFVKEDAEVLERSTRRRTATGLPPGALNYITAAGEAQLRVQLAELKSHRQRDEAVIANLQNTLASVTVVPPKSQPSAVVFGASVTVGLPDGSFETCRIAGVDEVGLNPANVSWVSPIGKALLGAEVGQRVTFPGEENVIRRVLKIESAG